MFGFVKNALGYGGEGKKVQSMWGKLRFSSWYYLVHETSLTERL